MRHGRLALVAGTSRVVREGFGPRRRARLEPGLPLGRLRTHRPVTPSKFESPTLEAPSPYRPSSTEGGVEARRRITDRLDADGPTQRARSAPTWSSHMVVGRRADAERLVARGRGPHDRRPHPPRVWTPRRTSSLRPRRAPRSDRLINARRQLEIAQPGAVVDGARKTAGLVTSTTAPPHSGVPCVDAPARVMASTRTELLVANRGRNDRAELCDRRRNVFQPIQRTRGQTPGGSTAASPSPARSAWACLNAARADAHVRELQALPRSTRAGKPQMSRRRHLLGCPNSPGGATLAAFSLCGISMEAALTEHGDEAERPLRGDGLRGGASPRGVHGEDRVGEPSDDVDVPPPRSATTMPPPRRRAKAADPPTRAPAQGFQGDDVPLEHRADVQAAAVKHALVAIASPATPIAVAAPPRRRSGRVPHNQVIIWPRADPHGRVTSSVPRNAAKPTVEMIAGMNVSARQPT